MNTTTAKRPALGVAFVPIIALILLLGLNVWIFGADSSYGPNQIAMLIVTAITGLLGLTLGLDWKAMLAGITKSVSSTVPAIIILLLIGALSGTWLLSGVIPAMVYYGLDLLHPSIFLFAACLISSVVSLATGSSWSTVGTVGIALLGIGEALGFDAGWVAGAVISGAYFGDKMSPLSDTTNLAPAMAGTDLFTHIRHMAWTTVPSITITLIIFLFMGIGGGDEYDPVKVEQMMTLIDANFNISPWLFLVPVGVVVLIIFKVPAIPALLAGVLLGGLFGIIFQSDQVRTVGESFSIEVESPSFDQSRILWDDASTGSTTSGRRNGTHEAYFLAENMVDTAGSIMLSIPDDYLHSNFDGESYSGSILDASDAKVGDYSGTFHRTSYAYTSYLAVTQTMFGGVTIDTGNSRVNKLLTDDGMAGMMNTIWLILCAMSFGGMMEVTRMLQRITDAILTMVRSTGSLIFSTVSTCLFFNATASDQYLAIVVPGRMFASTYRDRGLKPENLSRTLEDSGTVTSALIPWNTCGAYHSGALGVATGDYFLYAFFNLISPVMTSIFGFLGWKVSKYSPEELAKLKEEENQAIAK